METNASFIAKTVITEYEHHEWVECGNCGAIQPEDFEAGDYCPMCGKKLIKKS